MRPVPTLALCCVLAAFPAAGKPPLREVAEIDNGLMVVAIADEIRTRCDGIGARLFRALGTLNALRARALELGYSDGEIDAYTGSAEEKRRMRAKAEAWLAARGVDAADDAQLCAFGEAQIAGATAIGVLLR
jgi:hypothetical protein